MVGMTICIDRLPDFRQSSANGRECRVSTRHSRFFFGCPLTSLSCESRFLIFCCSDHLMVLGTRQWRVVSLMVLPFHAHRPGRDRDRDAGEYQDDHSSAAKSRRVADTRARWDFISRERENRWNMEKSSTFVVSTTSRLGKEELLFCRRISVAGSVYVREHHYDLSSTTHTSRSFPCVSYRQRRAGHIPWICSSRE